MGYNKAQKTMALRSVYEFDYERDYEDAKDALRYHIGSNSSYTWDYSSSYYKIYIYDDCPDIAKAASICREHDGKYQNPD